jgi:hypothetical protein
MSHRVRIRSVRTTTLSKEQMREGINDMVATLRSLSVDEVSAVCGWACRLSQDELWQSHPVAVKELKNYVEQLEQRNIFELGSSDLFIELPQADVKFMLCHESDVHFESSDPVLIRRFIGSWLERGHIVYVSPRAYSNVGKLRWRELRPMSGD